MKKIIILIIFILFITGCKVEYNLVIKDNFNVSETVSMTGTDDFFALFYKSDKLNVVNMFLDEGRKEDLLKNGYQYEIVEKERPYVIATKDYNNLNDFKEQTIFLEQYFDDIELVEENDIISLKTNQFKPIFDDSLERYVIKTTKVNITCPFEVIDNNATEYDKKTNTYSWYINDDTTSFSLLLSYDTNKIYEIPKDNDLIMVIVSVIFIIGLMITAYILNKKNK